MKRILLYSVMLLLPALCRAQQPGKVTEKWFPDPDVKIDLPVFSKKSGYTTHKEMLEYIDRQAAAHPGLIAVESAGKTQKGRDIPLVTVKRDDGKQNRLRVLYFARIHGDEPAGTEALLWLIDRLANDPDANRLLDRIEFYIMPMVNADGTDKDERVTANGIDLNRDQSKLDTPEAMALHAVANRIKQDISLDIHEYQPVKSLYSDMARNIISVPWDVMFLYSSNPNTPKAIRTAVDQVFLPRLEKAMDGNGLTHHTYYTPREDSEGPIFNLGGSSPRSTSNAMALRSSISLLLEVRGIKLGRTSILRRTWTAYLAALEVAQTAFDNEDAVRKAIADAQADRSDIAVRFSSKKNDAYPLEFLDYMKNAMVTLNVRASLGTDPAPTQTRPLPDFYYVLPSEAKAAEVLAKMGIEFTPLLEPVIRTAEAYTVTKQGTEREAVGGVLPVTVSVKVEAAEVDFPAGTLVVPTSQRNFRSATVLLEPESSCGFVNFRVIASEEGKTLPVYRVNE